MMLAVPTYVFATPVFDGQAALSVAGAYGKVKVEADATLTGPNGTVLSGGTSDSLSDFADLYPSGSLRWNYGNHNTMVYAMVGVPVGSYTVDRLANIGTNHWSVDGGGYTYFNTKTGLPGPQRVLGIRRQEPAGRLEHMANLVAAVWLMKQVTLKRTGVRAWSGSRLWAGGDP